MTLRDKIAEIIHEQVEEWGLVTGDFPCEPCSNLADKILSLLGIKEWQVEEECVYRKGTGIIRRALTEDDEPVTKNGERIVRE